MTQDEAKNISEGGTSRLDFHKSANYFGNIHHPISMRSSVNLMLIGWSTGSKNICLKFKTFW